MTAESEASIWFRNVSINSAKCEIVKFEALETFKSLVTSCSFNPLSSILQARQSFHSQAQQATVAADLLQAAMEVQHEVVAAMVLGARVTVKRFPNFFEALGLQSLIRFI